MSATRASTTGPGAGQPTSGQRPLPSEPVAPTIGDWLHIERDGTVVVYTGKAEMGQNIRTSLAQAVAEELRLPITAIQLVMADTACTPYDMGTVGSMTTPVMARRLHTVAAATRELLIDLAAARWRASRDELRAADGMIHHDRTGQAIGFGELTQGQRLTQEYGDDAPITPADEWTIAGTSARKVDARSIVTGQRHYTPDLTRPGMLVGKVLRSPAFGSTLAALDISAAKALPGVTVVHEGEFVGVAAADRRAATQALAAIRAEWTASTQIATQDLYAYLKSHPAPQMQNQRFGGPERYERGSLTDGRAVADQFLAQAYTVAYIAHAPLEPRAALAEWIGAKLTVWTGTQRPFAVRAELAQTFGIPEDDIRLDARRGVHLGLLPASRHHRCHKRGARGWDAKCLGVPQLQFGLRRHPDALRGRQSADRLPARAAGAAPGFVPRPRRDRQSLRARDAHGRACPHPWPRFTRLSSAEPTRPATTRGLRGRGGDVWLGRAPARDRARVWNRRRDRKGQLCRNVC